MARLRTLVAAGWVMATIAGLVAFAPAADGREPVRIVKTGAIDATGATDVTPDLQALFDRTPDGGVVQLERDGDYRVEGTIVLRDRRDLVIDGNGARIFATTTGEPGRSQIRILGGSGLKIRSLEIQGANPHAGLDERAYVAKLEWQHGISLEGPTDVEIDRVNIHDTYGDHIFIGWRIDDHRLTKRVWIHDSTFARSGRQGIAVIDGRDIVIERNRFTDMRRATVDLEPVGELVVENVHIIDNEVGPGRLLFVPAAGGGPINRIIIARNRLHGRPLTIDVKTPEGQRRRQFWVVDNTTDAIHHEGPLTFIRADGVVVRGNRQPVAEGAALVRTTDSCNVRVQDNDIGPSTRALEGESRECNLSIPSQPPEPPPVAGRGQEEEAAAPTTTPPTTGTAPTTAAPSTTPTTPAPGGSPTSLATPLTTATQTPTALTAATSSPDDGVAVPVVVLAMVLSALVGVGGTLAVSAWRARR
jgi:Right handed beta helix region